MPRERKNELSAAGVVLMLLVLFIHSAAECVTGYEPDSMPFVLMASAHRIASFAVQGFVFLAGLKLAFGLESEFSYGRYARGRLTRIGLPYLAAFCAFLLVYTGTGRYVPTLSGILIDFFTGGLADHFYFVFIMAQFCLLVPLWRFLYKRADCLLFLCISAYLTMICMDHLPEIVRLITDYKVELTINGKLFTSFLFYWAAGMEAGKRYGEFTAYLKKHHTALLILWLISAAADSALFIGIKRGTYYALWADDFHMWTSGTAILVLLSFALKCGDTPFFRSSVFRSADRASYLVYLWHPLVILFADAAMNKAGISSLSLRFILRAAAAVSVTPALCILWQKLFSRLSGRGTGRQKGA